MVALNKERVFQVSKLPNYIRISSLEPVAQEIQDRNVPGNVAEVGVFKGEFAKYLNKAFPNRKLYLFDTVEGFNNADLEIELNNKYSTGKQDFKNTTVDEVLSKMVSQSDCVIKKGNFPESLGGLEDKFCFVSLDPDLYKPIINGSEYFYPRLNKGGYIFVHDYNNSHYSGEKSSPRVLLFE